MPIVYRTPSLTHARAPESSAILGALEHACRSRIAHLLCGRAHIKSYLKAIGPYRIRR